MPATKIKKTGKTYMAKKGEVKAKWFLVDATDKVVGRLASDIAMILMGKHRPTYTPHVDCGDFVIVTNAEKIALSGKKWAQKEYRWYTGYHGLRTETAEHRRAAEETPSIDPVMNLPRVRFTLAVIVCYHAVCSKAQALVADTTNGPS